MGLTNALLKSFGIEQDQRDAIMTAHQETLEAIKAERDELRDKAARIPDLERQVEELKAADKGDEWKAKYDQLKESDDQLRAEHETLKAEAEKARAEHEAFAQRVEAEKADAEKLELYKGLLREIGLDETRVELAAKVKALDELTVEDGKLAGYDELKASEADTWKPFIPQVQPPRGQQVPGGDQTPPPNPQEGEQPNERAVQIARERHEKLYGKSEE